MESNSKYILKQIPEDFIVREKSTIKVQIAGKGKYLYFKLTKCGYGTLDALQIIAKALNLKESNFGFAGNKDKHAVTGQVCSVQGATSERISALKLKDIILEPLGYGNSPISLGDLEGNYFEIVVRNLIPKTKIIQLNLFPNYFDEQRFSGKNAKIGKHLLKKEFKLAAELVDDHNCKKHLHQVPTDFVGALKEVPDRLLRMYLNSYQSYLWNETLARFLRKYGNVNKEIDYSLGKFVFVEDANAFVDLKIPIVGFNSEDLDCDARVKSIVEEIMQEEKIDCSDFIIKQIPLLTLEGELRSAFTEMKELSLGKLEADELNSGKQKVKLKFFLGKGSYATMAVRAMLG